MSFANIFIALLCSSLQAKDKIQITAYTLHRRLRLSYKAPMHNGCHTCGTFGPQAHPWPKPLIQDMTRMLMAIRRKHI